MTSETAIKKHTLTNFIDMIFDFLFESQKECVVKLESKMHKKKIRKKAIAFKRKILYALI